MTASPEQEGLVGLSKGGDFQAAGRMQGWGRGGPDTSFIYFSFLFM